MTLTHKFSFRSVFSSDKICKSGISLGGFFIIALFMLFLSGCISGDTKHVAVQRKVIINGGSIEKFFAEPFDVIATGRPVYPYSNPGRRLFVREFVRSSFDLQAFVDVFNWSGLPREELLKVRKINFGVIGEYTLSVDVQNRELLVLPGMFFLPVNLVEEVNWGIGFIEYQDATDKAALNNTMDKYIDESISLELKRKILVGDFHQALFDGKNSGKLLENIKDYLKQRQDELEFNRDVLPDWNLFFDKPFLEKWTRYNAIRLEKIKELNNKCAIGAQLDTENIDFIKADVIYKSVSDCSFYSNSFDNILSLQQYGEYPVLYSLCFGYYFAPKTISSGFICPGYNRFRQFWRPYLVGDGPRNKISVNDFVLSFDETSSLDGRFCFLYSASALD
ncbi:MAG: hypothetical protein WC071_02440 [Victivallaceae bacterium]